MKQLNSPKHQQLPKETPVEGRKTCPLQVFFHFHYGRLEKVTLANAPTFQYFIEGETTGKQAIEKWIEKYLNGIHAPFPLALIDHLSPFSIKVLQELQKIPFGKTAPYLDIAKRIGNPQASRAVGRACGANPFPLVIPCHRIITSAGGLGGFAFGLKMKQNMLNFEAE